jgi:hypothetical protein
MSYCRWSSMNWTCDLYCYADITGGWTTHVTPRRRIDAVPEDRQEDFIAGKISLAEYRQLHCQQIAALARTRFEPLRLPHAGETFHDSTLAEFKLRLLELRQLGYRFPDDVIDQIDRQSGRLQIEEIESKSSPSAPPNDRAITRP